MKAATLRGWSRIDLKGIFSAIFTSAKDWKLFTRDNPPRARCGRKTLAREKRLLSTEDMRRLPAALHGDVKLTVQVIFATG